MYGIGCGEGKVASRYTHQGVCIKFVQLFVRQSYSNKGVFKEKTTDSPLRVSSVESPECI